MDQQEIWKDIPNYEGIYQVSNKGRVKSFWRPSPKIMKTRKGTNGYIEIGLRKDGIRKTMRVHQLVAMAFLKHNPNTTNLVVDHIDSDKTNNNIENLQLLTQRQNVSKDRTNKYSKLTGVTWHKRDKKWSSSIKINGKSIHLGYFDSEQDAALAYQKKLNEKCLT